MHAIFVHHKEAKIVCHCERSEQFLKLLVQIFGREFWQIFGENGKEDVLAETGQGDVLKTP